MSRRLFWGVMAGIASLAFMTSYDPLPDIVSFSDILNHFSAFFVLSFICKLSYPLLMPKLQFILLFSFGVLIEFVQYFLPTRSASAKDLAVDAVAIATALSFQYFFARYQQMRLNRI